MRNAQALWSRMDSNSAVSVFVVHQLQKQWFIVKVSYYSCPWCDRTLVLCCNDLTCVLWGPAVTFVDDEPEQQHQNRLARDQPDTDPQAGADGGPGLVRTRTSGAQHGLQLRWRIRYRNKIICILNINGHWRIISHLYSRFTHLMASIPGIRGGCSVWSENPTNNQNHMVSSPSLLINWWEQRRRDHESWEQHRGVSLLHLQRWREWITDRVSREKQTSRRERRRETRGNRTLFLTTCCYLQFFITYTKSFI